MGDPVYFLIQVMQQLGYHVSWETAKQVVQTIEGRRDDTARTSYRFTVRAWRNEPFRDRIYQNMRRELVNLVVDRGMVPVGQIEEKRVYLSGPLGFEEEIPPGLDWDLLAVTLEVGARRPT